MNGIASHEPCLWKVRFVAYHELHNAREIVSKKAGCTSYKGALQFLKLCTLVCYLRMETRQPILFQKNYVSVWLLLLHSSGGICSEDQVDIDAVKETYTILSKTHFPGHQINIAIGKLFKDITCCINPGCKPRPHMKPGLWLLRKVNRI